MVIEGTMKKRNETPRADLPWKVRYRFMYLVKKGYVAYYRDFRTKVVLKKCCPISHERIQTSRVQSCEERQEIMQGVNHFVKGEMWRSPISN